MAASFSSHSFIVSVEAGCKFDCLRRALQVFPFYIRYYGKHCRQCALCRYLARAHCIFSATVDLSLHKCILHFSPGVVEFCDLCMTWHRFVFLSSVSWNSGEPSTCHRWTCRTFGVYLFACWFPFLIFIPFFVDLHGKTTLAVFNATSSFVNFFSYAAYVWFYGLWCAWKIFENEVRVASVRARIKLRRIGIRAIAHCALGCLGMAWGSFGQQSFRFGANNNQLLLEQNAIILTALHFCLNFSALDEALADKCFGYERKSEYDLMRVGKGTWNDESSPDDGHSTRLNDFLT
jgi:hypothetical protein